MTKSWFWVGTSFFFRKGMVGPNRSLGDFFINFSCVLFAFLPFLIFYFFDFFSNLFFSFFPPSTMHNSSFSIHDFKWKKSHNQLWFQMRNYAAFTFDILSLICMIWLEFDQWGFSFLILGISLTSNAESIALLPSQQNLWLLLPPLRKTVEFECSSAGAFAVVFFCEW